MLDIKITPLELARVQLPDFHPEAPGIDTIYGFLVRDAEHCVLVDTGVGRGSDLIDRLYEPVCADLSTVLRDVGVSVAEITAIVNSHLHFDHCGNNSLFPDIPIYVQEAELKASEVANYTVSEWVSFPGARYELVSGSRSISANLELQPTPGHSPGPQSLVVRSGEHLEIVAAQASYTASEFQLFASSAVEHPVRAGAEAQECLRSNATWSEDAYLASIASLHRLRPSRVYFSHDPTVWAARGASRST